MKKMSKIIISLIVALVLISLITQYHGHSDIADYTNVAKFFAGSYSAKLRTSHSITYGLFNFPLVYLFQSIFIMKITSLIWMLLIILSVYYISNKNKRTLLLLVLSPIVWYMAPWISPIQLASLFFLWAFYFIDKFDQTQDNKSLIYSGLLVGLAAVFWNTMIFLCFFLIICFFYNRNVNHLVVFLLSFLIGLIPLFIVDCVFYGPPFYSMMKFFFGVVATSLYGSIYSGIVQMSRSFTSYITFILILPFFGYLLFNKKIFNKNKRHTIFLSLSFLFFFLSNPQIRYILILWAPLILILSKNLTKEQFKKQIILFSIITFLVVIPYAIQIKYSTNSPDFSNMVANLGKEQIFCYDQEEMIAADLQEIISKYPNSVFVVGNEPDSYSVLAEIYLGNEVQEFVSIQDYELWMSNQSSLFQKKFIFTPKIADRRQIWIAGGMEKSLNDQTDYESIDLAISIDETLDLEDFELIKDYEILHLYSRNI